MMKRLKEAIMGQRCNGADFETLHFADVDNAVAPGDVAASRRHAAIHPPHSPIAQQTWQLRHRGADYRSTHDDLFGSHMGANMGMRVQFVGRLLARKPDPFGLGWLGRLNMLAIQAGYHIALDHEMPDVENQLVHRPAHAIAMIQPTLESLAGKGQIDTKACNFFDLYDALAAQIQQAQQHWHHVIWLAPFAPDILWAGMPPSSQHWKAQIGLQDMFAAITKKHNIPYIPLNSMHFQRQAQQLCAVADYEKLHNFIAYTIANTPSWQDMLAICPKIEAQENCRLPYYAVQDLYGFTHMF
jgi:hypothetical protein